MATITPTALWRTLKNKKSLFLMAGPCVIEDEALVLDLADRLSRMTKKLALPFIFKASYDKANRSSIDSFRGPGLENGLAILDRVKTKYSLPIVTDVHTEEEAVQAAEVVDILQIPAFLSRQTNLLLAAANTGRIVNVKKGQFAAPQDMKHVLTKLESTGHRRILLTERGVSFGYQNLVADLRAIPIMTAFGYPVVFDATHSVQRPAAAGDKSSGDRQFAPVLARAAVAAGANGLFIETHPQPDAALSDGPNMIPIHELPKLLRTLIGIHSLVR